MFLHRSSSAIHLTPTAAPTRRESAKHTIMLPRPATLGRNPSSSAASLNSSVQHTLLTADAWAKGPKSALTASPYASLAAGFGLCEGCAGRSAHFILMAHASDGQPLSEGGHAAWEVRVYGPGRTRVGVLDHGDGSATVRYTTECSGKFHVSVRLATAKGEEVHLAGSPFDINIGVAYHPRSVVHLLTKACRTLRGLFTRWVHMLPPRTSRPMVGGRLYAVSNALNRDELQKRVAIWRRAGPHLRHQRLVKGVKALKIWAIASRAIAATIAALRNGFDARWTKEAFQRFRIQCERRRRRKFKWDEMKKAAIKLRKKHYKKHGLRVWRLWARLRRAGGSKRGKMRDVATKHLRRRKRRRAWRIWRDFVRNKGRSIQEQLGRLVELWHSKKAQTALHRWNELVLARQPMLRHRRKCLYAHALRSWLAFLVWRDVRVGLNLIADPPARERRLRLAMGCWSALAASTRFLRECFKIADRRRLQSAHKVWVIAGNVARMQRHGRTVWWRMVQRGTLKHWLLYAEENSFLEMLIEEGHDAYMRRLLIYTMRSWHLQADWYMYCQMAAKQADAKAYAVAIARWCEAVYARLTALRHMAAADALRRERKVRPGFHQWRLEARWRRHLSQRLPRQMRRRMAKRLQLRGFARWRAEQLLSQSSRLSMALRRRCLLRKMRRALALWLRRCDPTTLDARLRRRHKRWPVLVGGSAENLGWQPPKAVFKMKHGINSMPPAQRKFVDSGVQQYQGGFWRGHPNDGKVSSSTPHVQRVPLSPAEPLSSILSRPMQQQAAAAAGQIAGRSASTAPKSILKTKTLVRDPRSEPVVRVVVPDGRRAYFDTPATDRARMTLLSGGSQR